MTTASIKFPSAAARASGPDSRSNKERSPSSLSTSLTLAAMSLGYGVVQLDVTIVNTALGSIGTSLGGGVAELQWVVNSYTIAFAAFILTAGALGDRIGAKRVFMAGFAIFTSASVACALAPNATILIAARAVQGFGAAILVPNSLALLSHAYPDDKARGRAIGIWAAGASLALTAGPLVGGGLIALIGWRSIFLVNLPIGLAGLWLSWRYASETTRSPQREIDLPGQLAAIAALGCLAGAIIEGGSLGWNNPFVIAGFVASAVLAVLFIWQERRAPLLPDEQDGQYRGCDKTRDHQSTAKTQRAALDDGAGETTQCGDRRDLARQVDLALWRSRGLRGIAPAQPQPGKTDRQIDKEDRAPADQRDQSAADQRPGGKRQARTGRPDADRAATLLVVRIGVAEQRQRVWNQDRRAESLHRAGRDQDGGVGCQRTRHRRRGEDGKTRHEHPLGADAIAERARGQNEGGKGDGIARDHPLQFGDAAAERRTDAAERGVDDGDVELDHAIAEAHGRERQRRRQAGRDGFARGRRVFSGCRNGWDLHGCALHGSPRFEEPMPHHSFRFRRTLRSRPKCRRKISVAATLR